jgi:hypothetical protein
MIFPRAEKQFVGSKILKLFDADPDPGSGIFLTLDPGSGMEKFGPSTLLLCYDTGWVL